MILTALNQYYDRLSSQENSPLPSYGFSEEKIGYVLVLSKDGTLVDVIPNMDTSGKKPVPKLTGVPAPFKRPGVYSQKSFDEGKHNSFFLWDKTAYALGVEGNKDKATVKEYPWVLSELTFKSFKRFHLEILENVQDEGLLALKSFLLSWKPEHFANAPCIVEMVDANLVFKLDGDHQFIHQREAAQTLWAKQLSPDEDALTSMCLVTGEIAPVARLHPAIKGVYGGQSSGGSIVSFNADAYLSYGKDQGNNAPVSEESAFAYTTVLNYLLRRENKQCFSVGDASTVFWAVAEGSLNANSAKQAESLFDALLNMNATDGSETARLSPVVEQIAKGKPLAEIRPDIEPNTRFYVLGLAPNASRLSIRFWLETSFGELAEHIGQHFQDLAMEPLPWREPPSVWRLLIQTAAQGKSENIAPQLAGELTRSILMGTPYPRMMLSQLIARIRADGDLNGLRVAMMKAILQRAFRKGLLKEEIPMGLDVQNSDVAYRLGRLFAVLERIQEGALGTELNSSIVDKYYGSASSVPFSVFPRLLAGSKNHLSKIRKDKRGYAILLDKDLGEIMNGLENQFPRHMSIEAQGRFAIGYYHQRQSYFTKKDLPQTSGDTEQPELI